MVGHRNHAPGILRDSHQAASVVAGSHIPHDINLLTSPDIKTLKNMIIKEHFKLSKKIYSNEYETLNSKLMKNLKHEPTLRILDMEVYENKINVLQNQNGAYRDSFG